MPDVHLKGYILQLIARNEQMWDYDIAAEAMRAYGLGGDYWFGTVRLTLTDLFSGGLLDEIETDVDPEKTGGQPKLLFKFALNDFGRERMAQAGLLEASR
ncbi:MAG: hypothetical protein GEU86_07770 [Actinophytocola sp.]|nr:hypothetical protein [Actinophytocola sp.]